MSSYAKEIILANKDNIGRIAVIDKAGSRKTTWGELHDNILRVASYALKTGLSGVVPVYMERGMEAAAALLGLNLAGVGAAPLSLTTPAQRVNYIETQVNNSAFTIDTYAQAVACAADEDIEARLENVKEAERAYVVFTSGSTGTPKGVVLPNEAVLTGIKRCGGAEVFDYDENDRVLQTASIGFVVSIGDLLAPVYKKAAVYFLPESGRGDNKIIEDYVNRYGITKLFLPPQLYRAFNSCPSVKTVVIAGDKAVNLAPKGHRLVNIYGMSETTGGIFHYDITSPMQNTPIGVPCEGICAYVLDDNGNPADEGELCVSGALASEYLNSPELTAETFTNNPFSDDSAYSCLIHTGDIVRRLPDGNYLYLNRRDNMVKINGQRVEPGEIEAVMLNYPGISVCAVKGFADENQRSILCAYYVSGSPIDEEKLARFISEKLPHYMVPSVFVRLDTMPLNANGKLDRKALLMPDLSQYLERYEEPENDAERLICAAFEKVLKLERVGRNDDFFHIGGDSISALAVVEQCEALGISTGDIFAGHTPKSIALLAGAGCADIYSDLPSYRRKVPLTDSQMGVFLECGMNEESRKYNIPVHITFDRRGISLEEAKNAVDRVLYIHPALYSRISDENGRFYMVRQLFPEGGLCLAEEKSDEEIAKFAETFVTPIALGKDSLCRANVLLSEEKLHIFLNMHHIVSDGTSVSILCRQFGQALAGLEPAAEKVDAFALADAEKRLLDSEKAASARTYYENLLSGVETDSNLLADHKAESEGNHASGRIYVELAPSGLDELLKNTGLTENTFFMGVFAYTLAKMTGQNESVFTIAENGRGSSALANTVSMLVKTLPVVMRIDENTAPQEILKELQTQFFAALRNDAISFTYLAKEYGISSDVMFVYQSDMLTGIDSESGHAVIEVPQTGEALSNLSVQVNKLVSGYGIFIEYRKDMYEEYTLRRFAKLFERAADAFAQNRSLKKMPLISEEDKAFLDKQNRSGECEVENGTIIDVFRKNAVKYADKTAVSFKNKKYTYAQCDEISDRIAAYIASLGMGRGNVVSVLIPRCEYIVIASLGVLKSGAAYQPLDPSYPQERLAFMVEDSAASLVIADRELVGLLPDYKGKVLYLDEIPTLPKGKLPQPPKEDDLFILLYTSGTTGKPKGCMLAHSNIMAFVKAHTKNLELNDDCVVANYASYGFDAHMADVYPAIANGCELTVIPDEIRLDLPEVKTYCETHGVTHLLMTTQVARQFAVQFKKVEGLRVLSMGGEKLVSYVPENEYKVLNLYGPTEGTVCVTKFEVDKYYDNIPIGRNMINVRLYVADNFGRRVPIGVPGELIICGPQVGKGYLNRPEQTEKAFVCNIYEETDEEGFKNCYKTGDIVRFIDDGNIEFIGRRDMQVKIRGFRIELGEVERAIREFKGISDATVVAQDNNGTKSICAYVVSNEKIDIDALHDFIRLSHPAYMVPSATMQLDRIPLTVNGKVDKRKLPKAEMHFDDDTKPETELQQKIFDIAAEVVGTKEFGVHTDLYMAGLSSIGSIRLCSLLADEFGIAVQIRNLKKNETVAKLEKFVENALEKTEITETAANTAASEKYSADYPISKTMEGIFTECVGNPESTFYNVPYLLRLSSEINAERLKNAIVSAVEAHPYIKTELFTDSEGRVRQHRRLEAYTRDKIKEINCDNIENIRTTLVKAFKITESRLFDIQLINADALYLFINVHHIIADGTSLVILLRDIEKAYAGEALEEEKYNGFDVARDEEAMREGDDLAAAGDYYAGLLEGLDRDFVLLSDKEEEAPKDSGRLVSVQKEASAEDIIKYCKAHKLSLNAYFTSVFGFVLAKYAGMDYSVFNTVYNGRNDSRSADTFAMLVKTLPVVCRIDGDSVKSMIAGVSSQLMDSMANDIYSYAEISRDLSVKNDVMFIYQGDSFTRGTFCGAPADEIPVELSSEKTAMSLQVMMKDGKIVYDFEYAPEKFTEKLAKAFVSAYDTAAAAFAVEDKPQRISILSKDAEMEMERFNDTEYSYDRSLTISSMFLEKAKKYPEKLCVSYKDIKYTYEQAEQLSGKIALLLMQNGIGRGDVVSILINRDENMVISAHGTVRAGAAYLGLDPTYPKDRLEFMIEDSGSKYLIADRRLVDLVSGYKGKILFTDEIEALPPLTEKEYKKYSAMDKHRVTPENDAIVIYSSGTTGKPKGTVLQHKSIVCFFHNYTSTMEIDADARVATYASFGFDGGAMDIFCVPMAGASLYVVPDEIRLDLNEIERFYIENGITYGFMTTQVGCMFISNTKSKTLKSFVVGGEKLIPSIPSGNIKFYNGYGPSETMCYVNHYRVHNTGKFQPIGEVSNNTKEYIIDKFRHRLPFGACGELCISGGQLGRGYLNRPEKTAEVFVENPFSTNPDYRRMYRTGDVVRMLTDGNYDFVGRRDGQVKIRGFRIELGEVEQQIKKFDGVKNAIVQAFDNPSGGKALAAYIVSDTAISVDELKVFIGREKPDYMIPAVIMQIEEIPLTSNGKVDTRKLPKPELGASGKGTEPANDTEKTICRIFGEVLKLEKVYADDDFFEIGGSSISAIQVVVKCEQAGFEIVYKNLFANPTAQKLSAMINGAKAEDVMASDLDKNVKHEYTALKYNVVDNVDKIRRGELGDVLLTGVTGFLGSHVYRELMNETEGKVICLVRGKNGLPAQERFEMMMVYYFDEWYCDEYKNRTVIIEGDLENESMDEKLRDIHFDTIINCAANVKHFAQSEELMYANYSGVENLIALTERHNAKLIQISSLSVSGESVNGSVPAGYVFKESDLNIGQSLENQYVYTKYLAEQAVIDAVSRKLIHAKIIRLGNLMARIDDSEFQVNANTNGFLRMFMGFNKLGCFPVSMMDAEVEFSPIDSVAKAVVLLSGTPDEFTVFHAKNCNKIHYGYLLSAINKAGKKIEVVPDEVYSEKLEKMLGSGEDITELGGLLAYNNSAKSSVHEVTERNGENNKRDRVMIASETDFTVKALYRLGFAWPLVSDEYLEKMARLLIELNFFD